MSLRVKLRENEPPAMLIKRFKKLCEKEGLTKDIKRAAIFEKPSEKRRRSKRRPRPVGKGGRFGEDRV